MKKNILVTGSSYGIGFGIAKISMMIIITLL